MLRCSCSKEANSLVTSETSAVVLFTFPSLSQQLTKSQSVFITNSKTSVSMPGDAYPNIQPDLSEGQEYYSV